MEELKQVAELTINWPTAFMVSACVLAAAWILVSLFKG